MASLGLVLAGAGRRFTWWRCFHAHGRRFIEAVHVALHLVQKPLLLSFWDAAETHS